MNKLNKVILSLGANLGDKQQNIEKAISELLKKKIIEDCRVSKLQETKALLKENSPKEWDINFYNAVISGYTSCSPARLLREVKLIEKTIGRVKKEEWGPREIDIDILFYSNLILDEPNLHIPHKEFLNRNFLIKMLAEIEPNFLYPKEGKFFNKKIKDLLEVFSYETS